MPQWKVAPQAVALSFGMHGAPPAPELLEDDELDADAPPPPTPTVPPPAPPVPLDDDAATPPAPPAPDELEEAAEEALDDDDDAVPAFPGSGGAMLGVQQAERATNQRALARGLMPQILRR